MWQTRSLRSSLLEQDSARRRTNTTQERQRKKNKKKKKRMQCLGAMESVRVAPAASLSVSGAAPVGKQVNSTTPLHLRNSTRPLPGSSLISTLPNAFFFTPKLPSRRTTSFCCFSGKFCLVRSYFQFFIFYCWFGNWELGWWSLSDPKAFSFRRISFWFFFFFCWFWTWVLVIMEITRKMDSRKENFWYVLICVRFRYVVPVIKWLWKFCILCVITFGLDFSYYIDFVSYFAPSSDLVLTRQSKVLFAISLTCLKDIIGLSVCARARMCVCVYILYVCVCVCM